MATGQHTIVALLIPDGKHEKFTRKNRSPHGDAMMGAGLD